MHLRVRKIAGHTKLKKKSQEEKRSRARSPTFKAKLQNRKSWRDLKRFFKSDEKQNSDQTSPLTGAPKQLHTNGLAYIRKY